MQTTDSTLTPEISVSSFKPTLVALRRQRFWCVLVDRVCCLSGSSLWVCCLLSRCCCSLCSGVIRAAGSWSTPSLRVQPVCFWLWVSLAARTRQMHSSDLFDLSDHCSCPLPLSPPMLFFGLNHKYFFWLGFFLLVSCLTYWWNSVTHAVMPFFLFCRDICSLRFCVLLSIGAPFLKPTRKNFFFLL